MEVPFVFLLVVLRWSTAFYVPAPRTRLPPPIMAGNVEQTKDTNRETVMTFQYTADTEREQVKYGATGNGMAGPEEDEYDVVVIGSGMGGLACGAMSALYGSKTLVLESHLKMGGSAHTFSRKVGGDTYSFEVGPSIFEGLDKPSLNPLRIVIDALGEDLDTTTYDGLGFWTPQVGDEESERTFWRFPVGDPEAPSGFYRTLREHATDGELAVAEWQALRERLRDLGGSTTAVSLLNLRQDAGFLATTAGSLPYVATHPNVFADLPATFDSLNVVVDEIVTEPFLRNFIDLMCIFCGFPAKGAMTAHLLYVLERFFEKECAYAVPLGGTENIAKALYRGGKKHGMDLVLNSHVEEILVDENDRAYGVKLRNGQIVKASKSVVSNATPFDTAKLLQGKKNGGEKKDTPAVGGKKKEIAKWVDTMATLPRHGAILHLFVAIDADKVVNGKTLRDHPLWREKVEDAKTPAHLVVQSWDRSLQDSQNLCSFFVPSILDPSVCPAGKHTIHVYSSGGEPYEPWSKFERGSPEYEAYKAERAEVLWAALEKTCIPDVKERAVFHIVGSPLAHEAFLRRDRGTYGMAWAAGSAAPYSGALSWTPIKFPFPNLKTPVEALVRCGDSCFPGIGTPSAAASGVIAANTLHPLEDHIAMLENTSKKHPLYKFLDPGLFQWMYRPFVAPFTPSPEFRTPAPAEAAPEAKEDTSAPASSVV
mmetsp:Transcript_5262/g.17262  ORF Transcript_5262/g.17262 Transcript_5262/m.17262 type:complete len:708 (-) Transcript_5262:116-2239(-)